MLDEARRVSPNETGGVLLGYWAHVGVEAVITDSVGPGPRAIHRRSSFVPDYDFHDAEIHRRYTRSGRRLEYVGDWHTHPTGTLMLSRKDRRTLTAIAMHAPARAPTPVMAIFAGRRTWRLTLWRGMLRPLSVQRKRGGDLAVAALPVKVFG